MLPGDWRINYERLSVAAYKREAAGRSKGNLASTGLVRGLFFFSFLPPPSLSLLPSHEFRRRSRRPKYAGGLCCFPLGYFGPNGQVPLQACALREPAGRGERRRCLHAGPAPSRLGQDPLRR